MSADPMATPRKVDVLEKAKSEGVFVPYFNWTYARDHGFVRWIVLGEVAATAKACDRRSNRCRSVSGPRAVGPFVRRSYLSAGCFIESLRLARIDYRDGGVSAAGGITKHFRKAAAGISICDVRRSGGGSSDCVYASREHCAAVAGD